jgi:hypothetical protein
MIEKIKTRVGRFDSATRLSIDIADITFSYPEDTRYPNLCVHHAKYGLLNPLEGRTVATLTEVHLALYLGTTIEYHDAFVVDSLKDGSYVFREHLRSLIMARSKAKKAGDELLQQMLKLYVNTLYGKVAQGITPKKSFDLRDGDTKELGTSQVTQAYFASMITGTLRAGLSALLVAMDELNKEGHSYVPISATTDGVLYQVGDKNGVKFTQCLKNESVDIFETVQKGGNIFKPFADADPILYKKLQEFPVLRLLEQSRKAWWLDEYIEIKHAVNRVLNIKTRGQIGAYCERV